MRFSTLFAIFGLAFVMTLALPAQTVRVIFVSGEASLQRPDEAALRPAVKGETVIIGTRIVTGADGRLVLTPMPGVKSIITPNTTLLLESVSETRTSATEVNHHAMLDLKEGAVVSDLQKPEGVTYDYSIRTARGVAGARGTTFTVGINSAGIQTIVVAHGSITISFADGREAVLSPGQLSITQATGETQSVNNIGELPEADQQVAQNWTETTINAIATALESGIELDPTALNNALETSASLGITLSPETQTAVDRALITTPQTDTTLFNIIETADPLKNVTDNKEEEDEEIITQDENDNEIVTPPPPEPTAFDLFRNQLTTDQVTVFDTLPSDIQSQLVTLNDLTITGVALAPDQESGLHHTYQDLRFHLTAFTQLSPEALAFLKTLGGSDLENAPSPVEWSPEAFQRTLSSWSALTSTEQNLITTLGAGEAIMDTSAGYISALLDGLDSSQRTLIANAGWGAYLDDLSGKPTSQSIFQNAGNLSPAGLAAVKFFGIDPYYFNEYNAPDTLALLGALTAGDIDATEQQILRQLGIGHIALESRFKNNESATLEVTAIESPDYSGAIDNTLTFYASLSIDEQAAARALGLGSLLYHHAPDEILGDSSMTALQRVQQLAQFYNDHPELQQALQDSQLFSDDDFLGDPDPLDSTLITDTLTKYRNLPERTRTFLSVQHHSLSFFVLANPEDFINDGPPLRSLADINALLGGLTSTEFSTLMDLDIGEAIILSGYYEYVADSYTFVDNLGTDPLQTLKITIGYYSQLSTLKKNVLRELGIIGKGNIAVIGADTEGLSRLLTAYGALPGTLRASTEKLDEYGVFNGVTYGVVDGDVSFFFPRGYRKDTIMVGVGFQSTGDLHVGATRYLRIDGSFRDGDTFVAGANKDIYLHAADLIDLNSTGFSAGIRSITMAAHTINLANIVFPEGSVASLNSKLGILNFGSSSSNGKVNFDNVRYGTGAVLDAINFADESRGNIAIGTLANPAALPTYTARTAPPQ